MNDVSTIVWTATVTLLGGCSLYFLTQVVSDLVINPFIEFRKLLADISFQLVYHANVLTNPPSTAGDDHFREVTDSIRQLAAKLRASSAALPAYRLLVFLRAVPSRQTIHQAGGLLIRLSNGGGVNDKMLLYEDIKEVGQLLRIDVGRDPDKEFKRKT